MKKNLSLTIFLLIFFCFSKTDFRFPAYPSKVNFSDFKSSAYPLFDGTKKSLQANWEEASKYIYKKHSIRIKPSNWGLYGAWNKSSKYKVLDRRLSANGRLYTKKTYKDFILYLEFKFIKKEANSKLEMSKQDKGNSIYSAFELRIIDSLGYVSSLKSFQYHNFDYKVVPKKLKNHIPLFFPKVVSKALKRAYLKKFGQWNTLVVIMKKEHIKFILNDKTIKVLNLTLHRYGHSIVSSIHPLLSGKYGNIKYDHSILTKGVKSTHIKYTKSFGNIMISNLSSFEGGVNFKNIYIKEI